MATTNTQAVPLRTKRGISAGSIFSAIGRWIVRNRIYLIAFAIPAALTYLAYAIFGLYPFGEESVLCLDLNGQYVYYFEALRDAFWGDGSISTTGPETFPVNLWALSAIILPARLL